VQVILDPSGLGSCELNNCFCKCNVWQRQLNSAEWEGGVLRLCVVYANCNEHSGRTFRQLSVVRKRHRAGVRKYFMARP